MIRHFGIPITRRRRGRIDIAFGDTKIIVLPARSYTSPTGGYPRFKTYPDLPKKGALGFLRKIVLVLQKC